MSGSLRNSYWPELSDAADAAKAVKTAAYVAFIVAGLTGILSLLALLSVTRILSEWAIVDAIAFGLLGFFLLRGSRAAAVLTLIVYVTEVLAAVAISGNPGGLVIGIIFTFAFMNGVRGAYSLRRLEASAASRPSLSKEVGT